MKSPYNTYYENRKISKVYFKIHIFANLCRINALSQESPGLQVAATLFTEVRKQNFIRTFSFPT